MKAIYFVCVYKTFLITSHLRFQVYPAGLRYMALTVWKFYFVTGAAAAFVYLLSYSGECGWYRMGMGLLLLVFSLFVSLRKMNAHHEFKGSLATSITFHKSFAREKGPENKNYNTHKKNAII